MKVNVVMPKMGESITEGTIIKWHKKPGDMVKKDEIIFEITTDKVDTEIPSPSNGVLTEILFQEQETVDVDTVVAVIDTEVTQQIVAKSEEKKETRTEEIEMAPSTKQFETNTIEIIMPQLGESLTEGTIIKWYKKTGDLVKKDEVLLEISTDKVDTEIPSPESGILSEIIFDEQKTVQVGTVIARLTTTGFHKQDVEQVNAAEAKNVSAEKFIRSDKVNVGTEEKFMREKEKASDKFYSPVILNIAQSENISPFELSSIIGTGLNGRITKKDVLDFLDKRAHKTEKQEIEKPVFTDIEKEEYQHLWKDGQTTSVIPMDNIRQKIMEHMIKSRDTSVHVSELIEADMTKIQNFIKKNKDKYYSDENIRLTYMPFIAYATIKALKENPLINSSIKNTDIIIKKNINLGIAVALKHDGLIVPNIKNSETKNIKELAKAIAELSEKAKNKKLTAEDITGGTFTISNYGIFGTLFGTPVINQPEVAILGVGAVTKKPVVIEVEGTDTIAVRSMMYIVLSHDHRIVDGMLGGKFLKSIKENLENLDLTGV